jgi:hypothetical protein
MKKTSDNGHEMTDAQKMSGSQREETTNATGIQQQLMYLGVRAPMGPHACQGPSRAGWNDLPAGSAGPSAILGGAARILLEELSRKDQQRLEK